ncbi:MAG TPA: quinone oxidoreductase [Geminicoccaceae bacterium]|nr:quinone oxidoreductase [Geminicoccaceae bacterium]
MRVRAVRIHAHGGPEALRFEEIDLAPPGPGEALVRHAAIGLNFTDIHHRTGRYPVPALPAVIGMEAAGTVEAVGAGVTEVAVGGRVTYASPPPGAYAEARVLPADRLVPLPADIDATLAAATTLKGLTAQYLVRGAYTVRAGATVLVHAAAGGVGLMLCQWAKHLGAAAVIGTIGTDAKADLARAHGCDHPIVYTGDDFVARTRALTGGAGVDVVYDSVGRDTFAGSLDCLRRRGTLVSFGTASGPVPPFDVFQLNLKGSLHLTSPSLYAYIHDRAELLERAADLFAVLRSGAVRVEIVHTYALADAAAAHRDLQARRTAGPSILLP